MSRMLHITQDSLIIGHGVLAYNDNTQTVDTTKYYTGVTSDGVKYVPESDDLAIFVVTITGVPIADKDSLTCTLSFE